MLRFGWTVGDHAHVSTSSEGWKGYALDPYDKGAFDRYWSAVVEPLVGDAKPFRSLKYLYTDSWEIEAASWTPTLREEFRKRRGYDLLAYLPVMAGGAGRRGGRRVIVFLFDFRRTMGDLAAAHHYAPFLTDAHRHGLGIHPESGGPHSSPFDAQQLLGMDDAPMSEFWARSWTHRITDEDRFLRQAARLRRPHLRPPAGARRGVSRRLARTGRRTLWGQPQAELRPGINRGAEPPRVARVRVLARKARGCRVSSTSPELTSTRTWTWWNRSEAFFGYLNRCQAMLQRGLPVADALVYYGDDVPNFAQLRSRDPAHLGPGYDYDVVDAQALLTRARAKDGKIAMPDGMTYRVLVLPDEPAIALPVLRKARELARAGVPIVGPAYAAAEGLRGDDAEVRRLVQEIGLRGKPAREALGAASLPPDFASPVSAELDSSPRRKRTTSTSSRIRKASRSMSMRRSASAAESRSFGTPFGASDTWRRASHRRKSEPS